MNNYNYIDLFAGAGGLSEGFVRQDFSPIAHVECDVAACNTLKTRASFYYLQKQNNIAKYYSYLRGEITRDRLYSLIPENILNSVINSKIGIDNENIFEMIDDSLEGKPVDLIIGGPPCQAYSVIGRPVLKHKTHDERTTFYIQYGRFLKKYKPKLFVFENVPGIITAGNGKYYKNLKKYYKWLGYEVVARILNAYDYGVIQKRERVIIIGWQKDLAFSYPVVDPWQIRHTRDDIFLDLPSIKPGENRKYAFYSQPINDYLKATKIRNGVDFVTQHITRPHNEKDLEIYKLAIGKMINNERLKNNEIPEKMRTQRNMTDFLDRFKVVDVKPHTMIAHIAKDGHHFIHPDISQLRSISVREAARIQSFPDDYYFEGTDERPSRTDAFKQIGNAVPPLLAEKIAEAIKGRLA
jgi:DNA (cytosine-5)-methyltransferase 1